MRSTIIENVRRNVKSDDWSDHGTGNSLGVVLLVQEACTHVSNFAESFSHFSVPEAVTLTLCNRLVDVLFQGIRQYSKQLQFSLRDQLHWNTAVIARDPSASAEESKDDNTVRPHDLQEVISPEVMVILHNFFYLRNHLDYVLDQIALNCLKSSSREPFKESHQALLINVHAKLRHQLSAALLMVTDATAKFCIEPACAAALQAAGDTEDRGEAGDQESAVNAFNGVLEEVKDFLQQAAGSMESAQGRNLKSLLGNSLQRAAVVFLDDSVFSMSFEPRTNAGVTDELRRKCCLVLCSGNAEFICKGKLPLLLDGAEDTRLQGEWLPAGVGVALERCGA
jgi:hypothetical protein